MPSPTDFGMRTALMMNVGSPHFPVRTKAGEQKNRMPERVPESLR